jgi:hypothetical protein
MATLCRRAAVLTVALACALLSFATARAVVPEWSRLAGLDVWNLSDDRASLREATERRAELEALAERSARREEAADHVTARLIRGAGLSGATDELMALFRDDAGTLSALAALHRDAPTLRHAFALHAIERVRRALKRDPARRAAVVARLQAEYRHFDASPEPHR